MTTFTLSQLHFNFMMTHAEQTYPLECCGLLMGKLDDQGNKHLVEIIPTENGWNPETAELFQDLEIAEQAVMSSERRFTISPQQMIQAQKQGRDRNLMIIGIYHSHPDHPAIPSEFDRVCAWSGYSYLIISVEKGKVTDLQNWSLDESQQFQAEELIRLD